MQDIKEMITEIIENPQMINWYYFLKFGFYGEYKLKPGVVKLIEEVMPEDSRLY